MATNKAGASTQQTFNGYLFSKLDAINSKSEEPHYYLQGFDNAETTIEKKAPKYHDDPKLRAHLATKVVVTGSLNGKELSYSSIDKYVPKSSAAA